MELRKEKHLPIYNDYNERIIFFSHINNFKMATYTDKKVSLKLTANEIDQLTNALMYQIRRYKNDMPDFDTSEKEQIVDYLFSVNKNSVIDRF
jgi:hypothetical protein